MDRKQYGKRFPMRPLRKPPVVINVTTKADPAAVVRAIEQAKRLGRGFT